MSERKNVHAEYKWVGETGSESWTLYRLHKEFRTSNVESANLYDSPSDVPDDCTPVRVRVETWEEEGPPRGWDGEGKPDGYRIMLMSIFGELVSSSTYPDIIGHQAAIEAIRRGGDYTANPVRIPTEAKRKVTLDPEPTETGCRCREALEKKLDTLMRRASGDLVPVDYEEGVQAVAHAVREALADCDCKNEADDE